MEKQKNRIKFWALNGIIAVVIIIFIIENWKDVTFKLLGTTLTSKGFVVFLIVFAMGFASGWLWEYHRKRKQQKLDNKKPQEQNTNS